MKLESYSKRAAKEGRGSASPGIDPCAANPLRLTRSRGHRCRGFVGQAVVRRLLAGGDQVRALALPGDRGGRAAGSSMR